MNIIQKIRSWFFGKEEVTEDLVIETPVVKPTKEEVAKMVKNQEEKPKQKTKKTKTKTEKKSESF